MYTLQYLVSLVGWLCMRACRDDCVRDSARSIGKGKEIEEKNNPLD